MDIENLVTMANQIGSFYESMPDRRQAQSDIASHIKKYWEPRMRRALLAHVNEGEVATALLPIVLEAIQMNRAMLAPVM